jgi:hypothetical protein
MRSRAWRGGREKLTRGHRDGCYIGLEVSNSWGGWSLSRTVLGFEQDSTRFGFGLEHHVRCDFEDTSLLDPL